MGSSWGGRPRAQNRGTGLSIGIAESWCANLSSATIAGLLLLYAARFGWQFLVSNDSSARRSARSAKEWRDDFAKQQSYS
jgi:hypothetical protein